MSVSPDLLCSMLPATRSRSAVRRCDDPKNCGLSKRLDDLAQRHSSVEGRERGRPCQPCSDLQPQRVILGGHGAPLTTARSPNPSCGDWLQRRVLAQWILLRGADLFPSASIEFLVRWDSH